MSVNKDLAELERKLEKIEELSGRFGEKINTANLKPLEENAAAIEAIYENLVEKQRDFNSEIDTAIMSFQDILGKIRQSSQGIKESKKELAGLTSIAQKLQDHQRGYNELTTKQLTTLKDQAKARAQRLEDTSKQLKNEENELKVSIARYKKQSSLSSIQKKRLKQQQEELQKIKSSYEDIDALIKEENIGIKSLNDELDKEVNLSKRIGEQYDAASTAIDGMSSALDKLGLGKLSEKLGVDEAKKEMATIAKRIAKAKELQKIEEKIAKLRGKLSDKQLQSGFGGKDLKNLVERQKALKSEGVTVKQTGKTFDVMKGGMKSMGKSLMGNLTKANLLLAAVKMLVDALILSDKGAGDLAKDFNMTYDQAVATRGELSEMAALSGDIGLNTKGLQETMVAVGKSLGSNAMLNKEDLGTFTKLRDMAGFTNDELVGIQKMSLVNGKTLEDNTKEILGGAQAYAAQKGLVLNEKQILRDISKTSNSIKLSLGNSADELARAAVEARSVGLNLEQVDKIADSLLQFESSIAAELEAELLLGRDINLEKARQAAYDNDLATLSKEISKEVGSAADFQKLGRIEQEALAKSVGMQKDELATMLMDQEALTKLSAKEGESAQQAFNRKVKEVGLEEAKKQLGDEQLANQFQQQSVQERFQEQLMKVQELFIQLAEPILAIVSPLMDLVSDILPLINILLQPTIGMWKVIGNIISGIVKMITLDFTGGLKSFSKIGDSFSQMTFGLSDMVFGDDLISFPSSKVSKMNDGINLPSSKSGYGDRTLFGPEGAIQLNNKDTVVAGTNLFADDVMSAPKDKIQVSNSTTPPKEPNPVGNKDVVAGISQLNKQLEGAFKFNQVSGIAIQ